MEFKKSFGSPLLLTVFCALILINGVLFWQTQRSEKQDEVVQTYLDRLIQYQSKWKDNPAPEELKTLALQLTEENDILSAYSFLHNYEEAKKREQNLQAYDIMYNEFITKKGIIVPEQLPDLRSTQIQRNANNLLLEQINYLSGYTDSVAQVLKNAERMSKIKQFAKEGSFSQKNILRTEKDFQKIANVNVALIPVLGICAWLKEERTDYFALAVLLLLVAEFFRERRKGLWHIIHASALGRLFLALRRIGTLTVSSILLTFVFYVSTLLLSFRFYREFSQLSKIFSAPLQSVPEFGQCTLAVTIGEFILIRILLKILVLAAFGVLFYAVMSCFASTGGAVLAAGTILGFEFLAYQFIPVQSFTNVFKFINLFPLLAGNKFFTVYQNLNLFTNPVSSTLGAFTGLVVLFFISCFAAVFVQIKKYPISGAKLFAGFFDGIRKKFAIISMQTNTFFSELFKQLISGRGLIILFLFAIMMIRLQPAKTVLYTFEETILLDYYKDFEGEVTEETFAFLEAQKQKAEQGKLTYEQLSALMEFDAYIEGLTDYEITHGTKLSVVNPFGYKAYFSPRKNEMDEWSGKSFRDQARALLSIAAVVLLVSVLFPCEKQKGMYSLLRSMSRGRLKLFRAKAFVALTNCIIVWLLAYSLEFMEMIRQYGLPCPGAPVRSIAEFREVPVSFSIAGYLLFLNLLRLLVLIFFAACTMVLTSFFQEQRTAVLCSVLLLLVPPALFFIGIPNFLGEKAIYWLLARYEFSSGRQLAAYLLPLFASIAGIWISLVRWCRAK